MSCRDDVGFWGGGGWPLVAFVTLRAWRGGRGKWVWVVAEASLGRLWNMTVLVMCRRIKLMKFGC